MFSNKLVCNIIGFIDKNIDRKISISDIEREFFYNRYYIMKLFKREMGVSITNYVNNIRIYNSLEEVRNNNFSLLKIGLDNGFYSLEYFSEVFKKVIGVSPSVYRNFFISRELVSIKDEEIISNNVYILRDFVLRKENYLNRAKPDKVIMKKLTIFKWLLVLFVYCIVIFLIM